HQVFKFHGIRGVVDGRFCTRLQSPLCLTRRQAHGSQMDLVVIGGEEDGAPEVKRPAELLESGCELQFLVEIRGFRRHTRKVVSGNRHKRAGGTGLYARALELKVRNLYRVVA